MAQLNKTTIYAPSQSFVGTYVSSTLMTTITLENIGLTYSAGQEFYTTTNLANYIQNSPGFILNSAFGAIPVVSGNLTYTNVSFFSDTYDFSSSAQYNYTYGSTSFSGYIQCMASEVFLALRPQMKVASTSAGLSNYLSYITCSPALFLGQRYTTKMGNTDYTYVQLSKVITTGDVAGYNGYYSVPGIVKAYGSTTNANGGLSLNYGTLSIMSASAGRYGTISYPLVATSTKYLRDDGTWQTVSASGGAEKLDDLKVTVNNAPVGNHFVLRNDNYFNDGNLILIVQTTSSNESVVLYENNSNTTGTAFTTISGTAVVNWGDGSSTQVLSTADHTTISHTYVTPKIYVVTVYKVTGFNNYPLAFTGDSHIKKIIMPEGITEIPSNTFQDCSGLETLILPRSLTSIGMNAGCSEWDPLFYFMGSPDEWNGISRDSIDPDYFYDSNLYCTVVGTDGRKIFRIYYNNENDSLYIDWDSSLKTFNGFLVSDYGDYYGRPIVILHNGVSYPLMTKNSLKSEIQYSDGVPATLIDLNKHLLGSIAFFGYVYEVKIRLLPEFSCAILDNDGDNTQMIMPIFSYDDNNNEFYLQNTVPDILGITNGGFIDIGKEYTFVFLQDQSEYLASLTTSTPISTFIQAGTTYDIRTRNLEIPTLADLMYFDVRTVDPAYLLGCFGFTGTVINSVSSFGLGNPTILVTSLNPSNLGGGGAVSLAATSVSGIVNALPSSNQANYYLRGDNTWQQLSQAAIQVQTPYLTGSISNGIMTVSIVTSTVAPANYISGSLSGTTLLLYTH